MPEDARQRAEIDLPHEYGGNILDLSSFAGDVAWEVSHLMENSEVRNVKITVEWEGTY